MAITKFRIETWNPQHNRYEKLWEGPAKYADVMMQKGYMRRHTRRLIRTTEEVLYTEKGKK